MGAPTAAVLYEYLNVWELVQSVVLVPGMADRFVWRWTESGNYSASLAYRAFFVGMTSLAGAKFVWRATTPPKVKFFFWIALHG